VRQIRFFQVPRGPEEVSITSDQTSGTQYKPVGSASTRQFDVLSLPMIAMSYWCRMKMAYWRSTTAASRHIIWVFRNSAGPETQKCIALLLSSQRLPQPR